MGYFSDDDEKKIHNLELENKNLASSVDYYTKRSKKYSDERKLLREEVSGLKKINEDLLKQISGLNDEQLVSLEAENTELNKKITGLEMQIVKDRDNFEIGKKAFEKKFSDLSKKSVEEKKTIELKCIKLSQQVSDFEKIIILEREKFAKEKKALEQKNVGFFKEISDGRKSAENDFEEERNIFYEEIRKLTAKLSELSTNALKEQITKSEFKKKIDLLIEERDSLSLKIKELEKIVSKVVVTEHTTPESKIHSPRNSSVGSFKTAASSHQKTVSSRRLVNSFDQIRTTNIFYDWKIDGSGTHRRRRKRYVKEKLVWKVKPVEDEKNDEKKEEKKGKKE
ncbi:hypothetical protein L6452_25715 [Arctium lappa]|uniref:Uncharacterized protein n=1 Tax=Arctium lappa TaxID=4217 RepID=A0ACB9ABT8_ARCLA|nr:hypothetical protein L6452_25715 [Arctium lappa]